MLHVCHYKKLWPFSGSILWESNVVLDGLRSIHRLVHMYHMFSSQSSASGTEHMYMYIVVEQWYVCVYYYIDFFVPCT